MSSWLNLAMELNNDEIRRYSRHLILPEVGLAGPKEDLFHQRALHRRRGLGSPIAMYLAAAGIGKIGILDFDTSISPISNARSSTEPTDVGRPKDGSAKETINGINPNVEVVIHNTRITSENALDIIRPYDIVVDGTDNFPTRYLTNDACVLLKKPNVYGSIFRFEGQASVFAPHLGGPCYRCLYPGTAAARHGPELRGRRRARRAARHRRLHPGHGNLEARAGQRQFADWPLASLQRARHEVPRAEVAARSAMPVLR